METKIKIIAMNDKHVPVFLEVLAALFLLLSLYPIMRYGTLAGLQVPQHYSQDGSVDIWTGREIFIYFGVICIALYSFITVCQFHPNMVNIPFGRKMSAQDRASLATSIARFLKVWGMAIIAHLSVSSYRIAIGKEQCLNNTVEHVMLICATVHLSIILLSRSGKQDSQ